MIYIQYPNSPSQTLNFFKKELKVLSKCHLLKLILPLFGFFDVASISDDNGDDVALSMISCDGDISSGKTIGLFDVELY